MIEGGKKVALQFKHTQKKKEKKKLGNQIPKPGCLWKMNSTGTDSTMFYRMGFRLVGDALSLRVIKRNPDSCNAAQLLRSADCPHLYFHTIYGCC